MSDANRGSGYAGPTQADRSGRSDEVADRAASPTSASSPSGHRGEAREGYATSPQASPFGPPNGAPASPDQYGSPWAAYSGGSNGSSSPSGPSQPGPASYPTNGNGYYSPNSDFAPSSEAAPTAAANAPGDALPADGQSGAGAPSWEPVAYRPKKPLRERWTDLTAKLSGRHESAGAAESDSDAAARVWASSAAAGGVMATGAAGDSPGQTQTEQTQPEQINAGQPVEAKQGFEQTRQPAGDAVDGQPTARSDAVGRSRSPQPVVPPQSAASPGPAASPGSSPASTVGGLGVVAAVAADQQLSARQEAEPERAGYADRAAHEDTTVTPWAPTAGPSTAVIPVVEGQPVPVPEYHQVAAEAAKPKPGTPRRTRKARLRLSRLDPWSVMKTSFLFSIAAGIMLVVAVYVVWTVIGSSGLFDSVNDIIKSVVSTPNDTTPFRVEEYVNTQKVLGVAALLACVDVIIFTALATLGSFLYNLAATMLGGLEITLAED